MLEKLHNLVSGGGMATMIKIIMPAFFLSAVKVMILIKDEKITRVNVILSFSISTILSATVCYQLQDIMGVVWLCFINSILTFGGENFIRAYMYKKDWDKIIDSIVNTMVTFVTKKFK